MLPYSREVLLALCRHLNESLWWVQLAAVLVLGTAVCTAFAGGSGNHRRLVPACLGVLWALTAALWYFDSFAGVNFLAPAYGAVAALQALLFAGLALLPGTRPGSRRFPRLGLAMVAAGFVIPLVDLATGPGWPAMRLPGLTPQPLILATAGCLLLGGMGPRRLLLVSPALLAGVTAYQAWVLGLSQDWLVPVGVALALILPSRLPPEGGHREPENGS